MCLMIHQQGGKEVVATCLPLYSSCAHTLKNKMQPKRAPASKKKTCGDNEFARILFDRFTRWQECATPTHLQGLAEVTTYIL